MNGMTYLMNNGNLTAAAVILFFLMFWVFKMMGAEKLFRWGKGNAPFLLCLALMGLSAGM